MPVAMTTRQIERAMAAAWSLVRTFKSNATVAEVEKTSNTVLLSVVIPNSDAADEGRLYIKALRTLRVIHQPASMGFSLTFVKIDGVRYDPDPQSFFLLLRWPKPSDALDVVVEPTASDLAPK